jgi:hypothetical protein
MKYRILTAFSLVLLSAGILGAAFEYSESGARNTALMGISSAMVDDASALVYNPALLGTLGNMQFLLTQSSPFGWDLLNYNSLMFAYPQKKKGTLAAGVSFMASLPDKDYLSQLDYYEMVVSAGYGTALFVKNFYTGIALRYLSSWTPNVNSGGLGIDIGFLYRIKPLADVALTCRNISPGGMYYSTSTMETLSPEIRAGAALSVLQNSEVTILRGLKPSLEFRVRPMDTVTPFSEGICFEYSYKWFAFRAGLLYTDSVSAGAGIGLTAPFFNGVSFDYGFSSSSGIGLSNVFSVCIIL